jgi:hypothetical protein
MKEISPSVNVTGWYSIPYPVKTVFRDLAFVFPVLSQGIPSSIGFCRCLRHALEFNEDIDVNVDVCLKEY